MLDAILNNTSLPNLHPALVHFPIALFPLALAFDLATVIARRRSLDRVTAVLYALAALTAWLTVWSGERAAAGLTGLPAAVEPLIEDHEEWAERFLWVAAAVALARVVLAWREASPRRDSLPGRFGPRRERLGLLPARAAVLIVALGGIALLWGTADRGGSLVYRSGVAVMAVPSPNERADEAPDEGSDEGPEEAGEAGAPAEAEDGAPGAAPLVD